MIERTDRPTDRASDRASDRSIDRATGARNRRQLRPAHSLRACAAEVWLLARAQIAPIRSDSRGKERCSLLRVTQRPMSQRPTSKRAAVVMDVVAIVGVAIVVGGVLILAVLSALLESLVSSAGGGIGSGCGGAESADQAYAKQIPYLVPAAPLCNYRRRRLLILLLGALLCLRHRSLSRADERARVGLQSGHESRRDRRQRLRDKRELRQLRVES